MNTNLPIDYFAVELKSGTLVSSLLVIVIAIAVLVLMVLIIERGATKRKVMLTLIVSLTVIITVVLIAFSYQKEVGQEKIASYERANEKISDFVSKKYDVDLIDQVYTIGGRVIEVNFDNLTSKNSNDDLVRVSLDLNEENNEITAFISGVEAPLKENTLSKN